MCFWPLKTTFSAKCAKQIPERIGGGGAPCFGGRTISFLVKFESSILCILVASISPSGYFIPHLMNEKADLGLKVPKKGTSKKEKMRKCPKTANFGHVLVYSSN